MSVKKVIESKLLFVIVICLFRVALDISYLAFVNPLFSYAGYDLSFSTVKYIESWIVLLLFVWFTPALLEKPSDYLVCTLLYAFIVPVASYYALNDQPRLYFYYISLCCLIIYLFRVGRPVKIPTVRWGYQISVFVVFMLAATTSIWFVASGGVSYINLDLSKVYEFREDVGEVINVGVMAYINIWTTKVVGPVLMGVALYRKNYIAASVVFMLHVFWFAVSAHKAVLFYPILIIGLWFWFLRSRAMLVLPFASLLVVSLSLIVYLVTAEGMMASLFIRRVFFTIAKNTFDYFEFFGANKFVFWSNSLTSWIVDYPYHIGPAKLIGEWRNSESHVNNSFISTAYMHAGVVGIFIYGVLAGMLFRLIDSVGRNYMQTLVVLSALLIPSRTLLLSADLPTALLSHGVGLAIVLAILMSGKFKAWNGNGN